MSDDFNDGVRASDEAMREYLAHSPSIYLMAKKRLDALLRPEAPEGPLPYGAARLTAENYGASLARAMKAQEDAAGQ